MLPIQVALCLYIVCRIFQPSWALCNTSAFLAWSVQLVSIIPQHHISKLQVFLIYFPECPFSAPYKAVLKRCLSTSFFLKCKCNLLVKRVFLLKAAFATAVLHLISHLHLASFVIIKSWNIPHSLAVLRLSSSVSEMVTLIMSTLFFFPRSFPFHSISKFHLGIKLCPVGCWRRSAILLHSLLNWDF